MLRLAVASLLVLLVGCSRFKGEVLTPARSVPLLIQSAKGKVLVYSFGYTSCPDVCPTALSRMKGLYRALGTKADGVQMAFVTVDPERDVPERLHKYVEAFDSRITPLRMEGPVLQGTLSAFEVVAAFRTTSSTLPSGTAAPALIDHTSGFLVVDQKGQLRLRLSPDLSEADMAADLMKLLEEAPAQVAMDGSPKVRIDRPIARVSPGGVGALYLNVVNAGGQPDRLLRVETTLAKAELHETVHHGSVAKMRAHADGFPIAAGGTLELSPGGKHVMLSGLSELPAETLEVTLVFENAGRVPTRFAVSTPR